MTRTTSAIWASLLLLGASSFALPAAAESDQGGMMGGRGMTRHDDDSGGMMGGMMGNSGMMGGMMGGGMMGNDGNSGGMMGGMMGNGGMMGSSRPNEQWRHHSEEDRN